MSNLASWSLTRLETGNQTDPYDPDSHFQTYILEAF